MSGPFGFRDADSGYRRESRSGNKFCLEEPKRVPKQAGTNMLNFYWRATGVGVKGVAGRDAIVHKRQRNSSQKSTQ